MSSNLKDLLVLTACVFALMVGFGQAETMQVVGVGRGDTLNVRSGPGASYADIGDIGRNEKVEVRGYNSTRTWAQIRYRGRDAWVSAKYLSAFQAKSQFNGQGGGILPGSNIITGIPANDPDGGLVVRDGAGQSFAALGVLPNGTQIHVIQLDRLGKWGMITIDSGVGWVSTAYLAAMASEPTASAPGGGPLPGFFTVTGIDAQDKLWVRDAPRASGKRIGGFMAGTVVNVTAPASGNWVQVTLNGQIGYVNATYLTRSAELRGLSTPSGFPLGTTCRGTEPYWTLTIAEDGAVQYTSLINGADPITTLSQATPAPSGGYPFQLLASPYTATVTLETCSDGMSDTVYPMGITLQKPPLNGVSGTLYGCCIVD
ncbi:SH3 domain-containing protein [Pseudorhodobacter sp. W20_MBD10_FR17]|uniref:SH3 domain-containing protein n=1 Tax=Pseudorhodobacter sp. W20_MBD10_FR17 TaxID=3240266 RepID=UPI003F9C0D7A